MIHGQAAPDGSSEQSPTVDGIDTAAAGRVKRCTRKERRAFDTASGRKADDGCQRGAICKGRAANGPKRVGEVHGHERGALAEGRRPDLAGRVSKSDAGEGAASTERFPSKDGDSGGQAGGSESGAAEGVRVDLGQAIWQINGLERSASPEG